MARKPIAPGHDPRRKLRAPSEVEMLTHRLRQAEQRYAALTTDDEPAAGSGYGRDGSQGNVIQLSSAGGYSGAYGSHSAAMQMQTLAQLGGVNPLWGSNEASQIPDMPKVSDTNAPKGMMASTGTANYAGIVQMDSQGEYNTDFYWRHGIRIYDEMARSDPQVRLMLQMVTQPIRSAQPTVVPGSDDPMDIEIASFVETCLLEGMRYEMPGGAGEVYTSWDDILRHALSMFQYGFALFELCYTVDDTGFVKWSRWLPMIARTVWRWWINNENDLVGVQQYAFKDYKFQFVNIPIQKLLRFTHMQEGSNYDGVPMLRSAYPAWYYKQQFQRIEAVGIERNSIVPVVVKLPAGATISEYGKATTIVQNMRVNEKMGVVVPANWELSGLEGITNHGRGGIQIQETIQYYDIQIARAFAAQFVNLGSTDTGARSLDMSQKRTFLQMLQAECQYLEDVINTVAVKRLVDYNYTNVSIYPKVKFPSLMAGEVSDIAQTIFQLAQVQFLHPSPETEDMLRKALYLPDIPHSLIESTNPAGPDEGSDGGEDQQDSQGNTSGGNDAGDDEATGDDGGGDGGAGMRELVRESMLLREALDAAYNRDAVQAGEEHYGRGRGGSGDDDRQPAGGDDSGRSTGAAGARAELREGAGRSRSLGVVALAATGGHHQGYGNQPGEQYHGPGGRWLPGADEPPGGGSGNGAGARESKAAAPKASRSGGGGNGGAKQEGKYALHPDSQLRSKLSDPTDAKEAWDKAGGTRQGLHDMLAHEGNGVLEAMARNSGLGMPKGYDRLKSADVQRRALANHVADRMAEVHGEPIARTAARAKSTAQPKSAQPKEDLAAIHERAAQLQREQGLRPEVQPADLPRHANGWPVMQDVAASRDFNPLSGDAHVTARIYGEERLGAVLNSASRASLVELAEHAGMNRPYPSKNAELLSRLVAHVTQGRYSANFARSATAAHSASSKSASGHATHQARIAKLEGQLAKARADYEAFKAKNGDAATLSEEGRALRLRIRKIERVIALAEAATGESITLTGGHEPGYNAQAHGPGGRWLPGQGKQSSAAGEAGKGNGGNEEPHAGGGHGGGGEIQLAAERARRAARTARRSERLGAGAVADDWNAI